MAHLKRVDKRSKKKQQEDVLTAFEVCANVTTACKKSKIPRRTFYNWMTNDAEFKTNFEKSNILATGTIEDEIRRRAIQGIKKPVYQGGVRVGYVQEYSDTLLLALANAHMPDKYKRRHEVSGPNGGPIPLPAQTHVMLYIPDNGRDKAEQG